MIVILFVGILVGIGYCFSAVSTKNLTNQETTLLSLLLTLLSVFAGWLVTHIYAQSQEEKSVEDVQERSRENLRTYALKASEKVNNLSNELDRLAGYLEQELEYDGYASPADELHGREERIESAIHIIRTLKSVNDTSLSDWEGVIGDELDEQREERKERQEQLTELAERVDLLSQMQRDQSHTYDGAIQEQLARLRAEVRAAVSSTGVPVLTPKTARKAKEVTHGKCPSCGNDIEYRQRASEGGSKSVRCKTCGERLVSIYRTQTGFTLEKKQARDEAFKCPICSADQNGLLANTPGSNSVMACTNCGKTIRLSRTTAGVVAKQVSDSVVLSKPSGPLDTALVEKVGQLLPPQPWPTGIHKKLATELGVRPAQITDAIQELIRTGKFRPQVDGTVLDGNDGNPSPSR